MTTQNYIKDARCGCLYDDRNGVILKWGCRHHREERAKYLFDNRSKE